jgi:hypothetical protein
MAEAAHNPEVAGKILPPLLRKALEQGLLFKRTKGWRRSGPGASPVRAL